MKRTFALLIAGSLTMIVAVALVTATLSSLTHPAEASNQATSSGLPESTAVIIQAPPQNQIDAERFEIALQERDSAWQTQIAQRQTSLAELDRTATDQINQLQAQLLDLQARIEQTSANLPELQANAAALQQAIQRDDGIYQAELARLAETEAQLRQQLEAATAQLSAAYQELAQRQTAAAAAAGGGGNNGDHHDDDDHYGGHDDDDDDDDHESHEDDD